MKTILFTRTNPTPRIYNELYSLKNTNNYKLILLCESFYPPSLKILTKVFDEIIYYKPPVLNYQRYGLVQKGNDSPKIHQLKNILTQPLEKITKPITAKRLSILINSIHADLYNCRDTYALTKKVLKTVKKPVLMDLQDGTIVAGVNNLTESRRNQDKYCFENVSGIMHRGPKYEIEYYKKYGYNIKCPILNYLDYCNKEFFVDNNKNKLSLKDGECHIISMGSGMNHPHILSLIKRITKQKIHFHLYLVPHSTLDFNIYNQCHQLHKKIKYFHLEKAVPFHKIQEEISKYDYGAMVHDIGYLNQMQPEYKKTCLSYRLFNWFEAGLPVIMSNWYEYMSDIIDKNNIGFSVSEKEIDNLDLKIHKIDYDDLRKNVIKYRENYQIDNYNKNLLDFYKKLI